MKIPLSRSFAQERVKLKRTAGRPSLSQKSLRKMYSRFDFRIVSCDIRPRERHVRWGVWIPLAIEKELCEQGEEHLQK
jgi:hypothetical protein